MKVAIQEHVFDSWIGVPTERRLEGGQFLLRLENDVLSAGFRFFFHDNGQIEVSCNSFRFVALF